MCVAFAGALAADAPSTREEHTRLTPRAATTELSSESLESLSVFYEKANGSCGSAVMLVFLNGFNF